MSENSENCGNKVQWNPDFHNLAEIGGRLDYAFAPFVKIGALKNLAEAVELPSGFNLVVSWKPSDIRDGVSDLAVYDYAKEHGFKIFRNKDLHLKLFVYPDDKAFLTSGNLTGRGLGTQESRNLEVGVPVTLGPGDWSQIYTIIEDSQEVTQEMVDWLREHASPETSESTIPPEPDWEPADSFSITQLPATQSPDALFDLYSRQDSLTTEESRQLGQDLATFKVPQGLDKDAFLQRLSSSLNSKNYITQLLEWLQEEGSLRFGEISAWAHNNCNDRPVPYRRDVKTLVNHLYDWLEALVPAISWDRNPHSQILRTEESIHN